MASTSLSSSSSLYSVFNPLFSSNTKLHSRKTEAILFSRRRIILVAKMEAHDWDNNKNNNYYGGRQVDESMIVLRKRIHEMKMAEGSLEPPYSDWTDWEKTYFTNYDSLVCEFVGVLQSKLMNTRPSVAIGVAALIALSVPLSTGLVLLHLMEMAKIV